MVVAIALWIAPAPLTASMAGEGIGSEVSDMGTPSDTPIPVLCRMTTQERWPRSGVA